MTNPSASDVVVLDGGLATEVQRRGCDVSGPLWSARALLDNPDAIEAVHIDYLLAGADCVTTASYQVSFEGFEEVGLSRHEAIRAFDTAIEIAQSARATAMRQTGRRAWIAASLGPYGAILHDGSEYHGRYTIAFDDLVTFHRARLRHLHRPGVDLIAAETIPSLEEAQAILEALNSVPEARVWFAFTCADDRHTAHGETLSACAQMLDRAPQVAAIGVNCTAPHLVSSLIDSLRTSTRKPIVVYPNSGEHWDAQRRGWVGHANLVSYGDLAREWYARGARWIGGCCRTTPADIAQVRGILKPDP